MLCPDGIQGPVQGCIQSPEMLGEALLTAAVAGKRREALNILETGFFIMCIGFDIVRQDPTLPACTSFTVTPHARV